MAKSKRLSVGERIYNNFSNFFYWNSIFIINIFGVVKDFRNYFYVRKNVKKISKLKFWKDMKFRIDWFGMPYTVINYNEEFFELNTDYQKKIIIRDLAKLFKEFEEYDFWELLTLKNERVVEDGVTYNAVLVYFRPMFYFISLRNIIWTILLILLIYNIYLYYFQ